jgi:transposase-like protein
VKKKTPAVPVASTPIWEGLESFVRSRIQETVQSILEEEVTTLLGRGRSERREAVDAASG